MSAFDRLARDLQGRLDELVQALLGRLQEQIPYWSLESALGREELITFSRASLETELRFFRCRSMPDECPQVDAAAARTVAKLGELKLLLHGYRAGQVTLWDAWLDLVEAAELDPAERRRLLVGASDFFFRYTGLLCDYVADVFQRELEANARDGEAKRLHAVRRLLEGDSRAASGLDFELERHHLGAIAWGADAEHALRALASLLDRPLLTVGPLNGTFWGWLSGSKPLERDEERRLERFQPPAEAGVALGLQGYGEAGFRATHRQAQRARWAARPGGSALVRYADVAIESLAGENREEACAFVARELAGINDDSLTSGRIRDTLAAYFAAEHNAASAAAVLEVHQQTVANRLRAAEERLGHPIGSRRVELEVALRLRAALDAEPT